MDTKTCQCQVDWTDGAALCEECGLPRLPPEPTDFPIDHPLRQAWLLAFAPDAGYVHHKNGDPRDNTRANLEIRGGAPSIVLRPETPFEALVEEIIDAVWDAVDADSVLNRARAFGSVAAILQREA